MGKFADKVAKTRRKFDARLRASGRDAVQRVVHNAQRTIGEGGRMRIDTGFLRASIQAAIGHMPSGPSSNPPQTEYPVGMQVAGEPVSVTLLKWDIGRQEVLYVGWTANYARYREYHDGFLRGAVELWGDIADGAAKRAIATIK